MSELLTNIKYFVEMILKVLVKPNTGAANEAYSIFNYLLVAGGGPSTQNLVLRNILLLTFAIFVLGGSIGIFRRLLSRG